ncbi:MAG: TonB family protein [Candidatus Saccharicenans sp.]|nr:TonB family protein [Candidatus Saccharicenans sp.]
MAKKKILLIDYDQEFLKFLSSTLAGEGYEIHTANDGLSGLEKLSEVHPDLVIMEAMLPKIHGFELCSRITSHPAKKAPVIFVTGIYKDSVYKTEALRNLGASGYFEKPLNLEALLNKIYELIGKPEVRKATAAAAADEDLDQLLKKALSTDEEKKSTAKARTAPSARTNIPPRPVAPPADNKDDEVDLILKLNLQDLIVDTQAPEKKDQVVSRAARTEKEKPVSRPVEPPRPKAPVDDVILESLAGKKETLSATGPVHKIEPGKPEVSREPATPPLTKKETEIKKTSYVEETGPSEILTRPTAPAINPFKGIVETREEEEKKEKRSGAGKYIGLAAALLAVTAVVVLLSFKKKEAPSFSPQASQQVAAMQTGNPEPVSSQKSEEEIQKEIEQQMAAFKAQKGTSEVRTQNVRSASTAQSGRTGESVAAPLIPEQKTSLASINVPQSTRTESTDSPVQTEPPVRDAGNTTVTEETEASGQQNEAEPKVTIPVQDIKPGDLVPLNIVDVEPRVLKSVEPVYPEADRRLGIKGQVLLNVLISENGDVLEARVIRGIKGSVALEKEAINAVKKWKFLPAEKNGVKVRVWKPIAIGFGLS